MFGGFRYGVLILAIVTVRGHALYAQDNLQKRRDYLQEIIKLQEHPNSVDSFVSYHDRTWMDWVRRTGELPPDFDALPSIPFLPDPLIMDEGGKNIPIRTPAQWKEQREYFKEQAKHLFCGTFPPPPSRVEAKVLREKTEGGVKIQLIELRFGEDPRAKLDIELFTPPGKGPFPVFMTQWNHRGWAQIAVRRGYMALVYAGADDKDDTQAYLGLYPDYDWTTLMTRAWGAHRAVDYLYSLDHVDKSKIAITGHSRNGKQSLLAAAFDSRITAVISSSGGTGGEFPYRYTDERSSNESIEFLYSRRTHWGHPRIRFYVGREHKLPIDQTSLMALIAPNALLLSTSIREASGDPWAAEQAYQSLSQVYKFLNAEDKLGIRLRDGEHAVEARDIESYMDWLDIQFKRNSSPWHNTLVYNYSFEKWKSLSGENTNPQSFPVVAKATPVLTMEGKNIKTAEAWDDKKRKIAAQINWIMGEAPPGVKASPIKSLTPSEDYLESFMARPRVKNGKKINIAPYNAMGDYLHGTLYYPVDKNGERLTRSDGKLPVVIFLHKYSNTGFDWQLSSIFDRFLAKGIAVLAMDLIGYGTRIEEGTRFYERYPHWSKMGKMVSDTRAAIDALETLDFIDRDRIYLSGYALGGTVSLFAAALDDRVAGTAVSCAFTPWRYASRNVEGLKAYSHLYGLLPRLGFFTGNESRVPVDFTEIISLLAPRPLLVIAPELDRHADPAEVTRAVDEAQSVYELLGDGEALEYNTPHEFNQLTAGQEAVIVNWVDKEARRK